MRDTVHALVDALVVYAGLLPIVVKRRVLTIAWLIVAAVLLFLLAVHATEALRNGLATPPMWDFGALWLYGRAAVVTHLPYSPQALHAIGAPLHYGSGFTREVLDVGFVYPLPTIALFAPLGLFSSPNAAMPFWYGLLLLALCVEIVLLWRRFFKSEGWLGLLVTVLIVMLFPTTLSVLSIGQTQFIAAVFFVLFLGEHSLWRRGMWLALACIVKPFLALMILFPLMRKQWRTVTSAVITVLIATVAVLPLIGWQSVVSYLTDPPTKRLPGYVFANVSNQSLLSWILRSTHAQRTAAAALHEPLYVLIAGVLVILTIWTIVRVTGPDREYSLILLLPLAMLIYPENWWHYTSMLVIPVCLVWSRRAMLPGGALLALVFTASEFLLSAAYNRQIFASLLAWLLLLCLSPYATGASDVAHRTRAFPYRSPMRAR